MQINRLMFNDLLINIYGITLLNHLNPLKIISGLLGTYTGMYYLCNRNTIKIIQT